MVMAKNVVMRVCCSASLTKPWLSVDAGIRRAHPLDSKHVVTTNNLLHLKVSDRLNSLAVHKNGPIPVFVVRRTMIFSYDLRQAVGAYVYGTNGGQHCIVSKVARLLIDIYSR